MIPSAMVVAPQPEAAEAGVAILQQGGNAADAAIAAALVQGVVDPQMGGLGGFGSLQVLDPKTGHHGFIDFHATAPAAARPDMWADRVVGESRDGFGFVLEGRVNELGYEAIAVPGSLKAWYEAQTAHGIMDWPDVVEPAVAEAEAGVLVRPHMHAFWTRQAEMGRAATVDRLVLTQTGRRTYLGPDGHPKRPGDRLHNPDLAATLRAVARGGAAIFYEGEIAQRIDADMKAHGGLLTARDLAAYRTTRREPLWGRFRGRDIATSAPPGGGLMLLEMLHVLEAFDLAALGHNSVEYIRVVAEAMKHATRDKDAHMGDPAFVDVPVDRLAHPDYARAIADRIAAGEIARVERVGGGLAESRETTHVAVVDAHGMIVNMTHSLGTPSGVITEGLGFMYNGCMGVFDPRPGRTHTIMPGKARFSSICPTIVFEGGMPRLVLGAPGGTQIAMGVLQVLVNVIEFGMPLLDAVVAPRFSATGDTIDVVNRIPRSVTVGLEDAGYPVARSPCSYAIASVHGLERRADGPWRGVADPAADGVASGV